LHICIDKTLGELQLMSSLKFLKDKAVTTLTGQVILFWTIK